MELYLDSADIQEIKDAFELSFLSGLTTTPTFMHRHGITDIDATILELANIVPVLQIEALGNTVESIKSEVYRQDALGLDKNKTVYKIPVSLEGVKACKQLVDEGFKVNIHLVYTLQQAYMAMQAGATYVCPLIGRLQDQGHDALKMIEQCVEVVNYYGYSSKIMFSSVRHVEHVRNALDVGVHTITAPWKIIKQLTENHFTDIGTRQFEEHTQLITLRVSDRLSKNDPIAYKSDTISARLADMTAAGFGALTIVDEDQKPIGIFTDGDLRRMMSEGQGIEGKNFESFSAKAPISIESTALLESASKLFQQHKVDCLVVTENGKAVGMLDIQNLLD